MEAARATWTDTRLDDLNERVKVMDTKMDEGFTRLDAKMDAGFTRLDAKMDAGFIRLDDRIDGIGERIDKLQHAIITVGGSLLVAFIAFLAAILGLIITLIVLHS
jgi:hypothetical protein